MKYHFIGKRIWDKEFTYVYVYQFATGYCILKDLIRGKREEYYNWEGIQKMWLIPEEIVF